MLFLPHLLYLQSTASSKVKSKYISVDSSTTSGIELKDKKSFEPEVNDEKTSKEPVA